MLCDNATNVYQNCHVPFYVRNPLVKSHNTLAASSSVQDASWQRICKMGALQQIKRSFFYGYTQIHFRQTLNY